MGLVHTGAHALLDLVFPPRCVHCRRLGRPLCAACAGELRWPEPELLCKRCGRPRALVGVCHACAAGQAPSPFARVVAAATYEGAARAAVLGLKYRGQRRLAEPLGDLLAATCLREGLRPEVLLPVPLHPTRLRQRGYNQAELLARVCGARLGVPVRSDLLVRTRATPPQVELEGEARRSNVTDAFALRGDAAPHLAGKRVLLLDDVLTTGSTLEAAALAVLPAGPAALVGLAVARSDAPPPSRPR